jgi:Amt family ammonium transporter
MVILISFWFLLVYCPIAHSMWHPQGWLFKKGVLDYAGGNVVNICSGMSGLATAIVIGGRMYSPSAFCARKVVDSDTYLNGLLILIGVSMVWLGWYCFNLGSAFANVNAVYSLYSTPIATCVTAIMWPIIDWVIYKQPTVSSQKIKHVIQGAIAGFVCIGPAAGYVDITGAFFIGFFGGPLCYLADQLRCYYDHNDSFDFDFITGGIIGGIAVAINPLGLSDTHSKLLNECSAKNVVGRMFLKECSSNAYYRGLRMVGHQLSIQSVGILFTIGWSFICTFCIAQIVDKTIGLKRSYGGENGDEDDCIVIKNGKEDHGTGLHRALQIVRGWAYGTKEYHKGGLHKKKGERVTKDKKN